MNKKENKSKSGIYILLISILSVLVIILLTILIINKPSLKNVITTNRKTNETVVSKKTIEEESDLKNAISKVYNSVVYIQVEVMSRMGTQAASGSGFVYKKDSKFAYILTNNHVIEDANKIVVTYIDGSEAEAEVVGKDEFSDVAVLKVKADTVLAVAELGSSDEAEIGDTVFTVGAPLGKEYMGTITKGIVSGINRKVKVTLNNGSYLMETIQTDATINSGNSGGPLCNISGQVIGITSSKLVGEGVEGMGFSIPIDTVNAIIDKLENGEDIERPYVGVQLADVSNAYGLQYYYNINISKDVKYGAILTYVEKNKPASNAGLMVGDVVVEMDGEKTESSAQFRYNLYKHNVGDSIKIKYYRGDEKKEATIKLTERIK